MKSGMSLIIFGTIFMWGGYLEWEVLRDPLFTFKEGTVIGGFMILIGCLVCTVETAAGEIVKAIKEGIRESKGS